MLDPSSSEEESDEGHEEERRDVLVAASGSQRAPPAPAREGRRDAPGRSGGGGAGRSVSPSPSVLSEGREEPERQLDEEQERKIRLQLYVFVVRCIAYPFNAKQPTDMARRQQKARESLGGGGDGAVARWGSGGADASCPPVAEPSSQLEPRPGVGRTWQVQLWPG
ncbi:Calcium-dependent secretion activator 2 [Galemys pyrenaicus]|uniref:Calcium-dependent secretion activator 2 n=1 Tax=Galemys pyrenaicus TaxID=202257 RepID=A0A8J6BRE2_GALPY|nr:Calcium-dependent secretion activator 2 [Galemys pyrenaicus]